MSKPLSIAAVDGGFTLHFDTEIAKRYGMRQAPKNMAQAGCVRVLPDGTLTLRAVVAPPFVFATHEDAVSTAHTIGRYKMGFGDLVFAYCDYAAGHISECEDAAAEMEAE